jgi:hypothetical protein
MPHRALAPALLAVLAVALAGCFQFKTLLRLEPDGSGTIEETILLSDLILSMMQGDSTQALFDEAAVRARADSFGTGVRFVRVDSVAEPGFVGYRAVYAFDDVDAVRLLPGNADALGMASASDEAPGGDADVITALAFEYAPGGPSGPGTLRIRIPRNETGEGTPIHPDSVAALVEELQRQVQEATLLRGFLDSANLAVAVALPAPVAETNARYVEDGVVTLVDLRFGAFFDLMAENPELAARLQLAETAEDRQAVLRALNEYEGLRFEPEEEVFFRFE